MNKLPFSRQNYLRMIIGLVVIAVGFTTMAMDSTPHGFGFMGLTLGPVSGRLIAEMMTGATPFCDPTPYSAERFSS